MVTTIQQNMKINTKHLKLFQIIIFLIITFTVHAQTSELVQKKSSFTSDSMKNVLSIKPEWKFSNKAFQYKNTFNASNLPFFCKIEHKIETGSKIAFRFRLGDLNYVNMLENKR